MSEDEDEEDDEEEDESEEELLALRREGCVCGSAAGFSAAHGEQQRSTCTAPKYK